MTTITQLIVGSGEKWLNFEQDNKMPQPLDLANGNRIVMVDKNGIKIADSDVNETSSISN